MNNNVIVGNPTKKFFIEMITRDISIEDAIIDLLDNSIDGANRINPNDYRGLTISISINESEFIIEDNCGGFSLETAQKYAFRFGRPEDAPMTNNTIGRFGIGMKRSLFKIGKNFEVETQNEKDHFKVEVDVEKWSKQQQNVIDAQGNQITIDDWNFQYTIIENQRFAENGTKIRVVNLNNEVKDLFADDAFLRDLSNDIQKLLNFSLLKGITILLNGKNLTGHRIDMLYSDNLIPFHADGKINNVSYRIIAGLGEIGEPKRSGWYIYCNNRLVLEADQTNITNWGISPIPQWHINHVMFRGLLFLDSTETLDLPLTTTKKGIDATSEIYKKILPLMKMAMISVLDFLKKIPLLDDPNGYRLMLCETCNKVSANELKYYDFKEHAEKIFTAPELDIDAISQRQGQVRIAFDADKKIANNAKNHADAKSYKELGKIVFDYYIHMEDIQDEES